MIVRMLEYGGWDLIESEVTEDRLVYMRRVVFDRDSDGQRVPRRNGDWTGRERCLPPFALVPEQYASLIADMEKLRGRWSIPLKPDSVRRRYDFFGAVITLIEGDTLLFEREVLWKDVMDKRCPIDDDRFEVELLALYGKHNDMLMPRELREALFPYKR